MGLVVALGACGETPPPPLANAASTTALTFPELRLYLDPQLVGKLHDDGTIEFALRPDDWEPVGRIDASGAAFRADGTKRGHLASDGTFRLPSGEAASWKLIGETLVLPGESSPGQRRKPIRLTIDAKGSMRGFAGSAPPFRFEGLTGARSRHVALFMYALILTRLD
jgi:hypothetical protein